MLYLMPRPQRGGWPDQGDPRAVQATTPLTALWQNALMRAAAG